MRFGWEGYVLLLQVFLLFVSSAIFLAIKLLHFIILLKTMMGLSFKYCTGTMICLLSKVQDQVLILWLSSLW